MSSSFHFLKGKLNREVNTSEIRLTFIMETAEVLATSCLVELFIASKSPSQINLLLTLPKQQHHCLCIINTCYPPPPSNPISQCHIVPWAQIAHSIHRGRLDPAEASSWKKPDVQCPASPPSLFQEDLDTFSGVTGLLQGEPGVMSNVFLL